MSSDDPLSAENKNEAKNETSPTYRSATIRALILSALGSIFAVIVLFSDPMPNVRPWVHYVTKGGMLCIALMWLTLSLLAVIRERRRKP